MFLPDNTHLFCTSRFYVLAKTQGAQRETPKRKNRRNQKQNEKNKNKNNKKNSHGRVSSVSSVCSVECFSVHSTIHWINRYPVDTAIGFPNTYSLDSDLSHG